MWRWRRRRRQACLAEMRARWAPVVTTARPRGGATSEGDKNAAKALHTAIVSPMAGKINVSHRSAAKDAGPRRAFYSAVGCRCVFSASARGAPALTTRARRRPRRVQFDLDLPEVSEDLYRDRLDEREEWRANADAQSSDGVSGDFGQQPDSFDGNLHDDAV